MIRHGHFTALALCLALMQAGSLAAVAKDRLGTAVSPDAFSAAGTVGTMVVHRVGTGERWVANGARADIAFAPSSSFKLPNTLIAFATGAITGMDEVMAYSGTPFLVRGKPFLPPACNADVTVTLALQQSCVPVYQAMARRIGVDRYREWLGKFGYGAGTVTAENVDDFWLTGDVRISAVEQVAFIDRLVAGQLPVTRQQIDSVAAALSSELAPSVRLVAKTGFVFTSAPEVGWFVGWVDNKGEIYTFALNLDMTSPQHPAARKQIALQMLKQVGAY